MGLAGGVRAGRLPAAVVDELGEGLAASAEGPVRRRAMGLGPWPAARIDADL